MIGALGEVPFDIAGSPSWFRETWFRNLGSET